MIELLLIIFKLSLMTMSALIVSLLASFISKRFIFDRGSFVVDYIIRMLGGQSEYNNDRYFKENDGNNYNRYEEYEGHSTEGREIEKHLKVMGFKEIPNEVELKKRYKKLAKKYHPDVYEGSDEKFKNMKESYDYLKDYKKKEEI